MNDPELIGYHEQSRAELIADVIDDTDKVARALEIQRDSDINNRRFLFDLTDKPYVLPHSIKNSIDPTSRATELTIDIEENRLLDTQDNTSLPAGQMSMQLSFHGERDFVIFITAPKEDDAEPFSASMIFLDDLSNQDNLDSEAPQLPLYEPLKKTEVNTLIASLVAPNKTHDYRLYEKMDLTSAHTLHHVAEALEEKADSTISESDYFTGGVLALDADQIKFIKVDGKLAYATVQRSLVRGSVTATITLDRDLTPPEDDAPQSFEDIRTYSKDMDGAPTERDVDFDVLVSIHDFLLSLKSSMFEPEITPLHTTEPTEVDEVNLDDDDMSDTSEGDIVDTTSLNIEDLSELNRNNPPSKSN